MSKGNPSDLRELAQDLDKCIQNHPDAIRNNPDIAHELQRVSKEVRIRYQRINEGRDKGYDEYGDLIP